MSKYQVMRDLTEAEYAELKQSIIENGLLKAIDYDEFGNILDGHHRMKICSELNIIDYPRMVTAGLTETEKLKFAFEVNATRRHLSRNEKLEHTKNMLLKHPNLSDRLIGKRAGASHQLVGKARKELEAEGQLVAATSSLGADGKERTRQTKRGLIAVYNPNERTQRALQDIAVVEKMSETGLSARKAQESLRREEKAKRKDTAGIILNSKDCRLFTADLRAGLPEITAGSVNLILIDPPYSYKDYSDIWQPMAQVSERILADHGILLVMAGVANLDKKMAALSQYLRYHWTLTVLVERASPPLQWMGISTRQKPVLVYVKKGWKYNGDVISDVIKASPDEGDKDSHHWGQNLQVFETLITSFSNPGDIVCDFCMGAGTTAIAALKQKRRFIGCDIDSACVSTTRQRIKDELGLKVK
jgi:site-specific DNA-methyltransferase (adenine-specific)